MIRRIVIILMIQYFAFFIANVQNTKIDSLENLLSKHTHIDTIRINLLTEIAKEVGLSDFNKSNSYIDMADSLSDILNYLKGKAVCSLQRGLYFQQLADYDKALDYFGNALEIFTELGIKSEIAYSLNKIGIIYLNKGEYEKSREYYQNALQIYTAIENKKGIADSWNIIGYISKKQGNYLQAIEYHQKALLIYEEIKNNTGIATSCNNLGETYLSMDDPENAYISYQRALAICKERNDKKGISILLDNIGQTLLKKGEYTQAITYFQKSLEVNKEINRTLGIAINLNNLGHVFEKQGKLNEALKNQTEAYNIVNAVGNLHYIGLFLKDIGRIYLLQNNYKNALQHSLESLEIADSLNDIANQKDLRKQMSEIYAQMGNYKLAYENYILYKELNDSIFNEKNIKKIAGLEFQYQYEKEKAINEAEQARKDTIQKEELKQQKIIRNSFIGGFIITLILTIIILRSLVQKRKANKLLAEQKTIIEKANEDLNDVNQQLKNKTLDLETNKEELKGKIKELEEVTKFKNKIFSIIGHDLRGPVGTIGTIVSLIMENRLNEDEKQSLLSASKDNVIATLSLLENILIWANSELGKINYSYEKLNLKKLIDENFTLLKVKAFEKSIGLYNNVKDDVFVRADKNTTDTIIRNIIANALKFTPKEGKIDVNAEIKNSDIEIKITDNGVGMNSEKLEKILDSKEHYTEQGTEGEIGSGIGLPLCFEFIKMNNGKYQIYSEEGKGTQFKFTLPNYLE